MKFHIYDVLLKNSPIAEPMTSPIGLNLLIYKYKCIGVKKTGSTSQSFFLSTKNSLTDLIPGTLGFCN